MLHITVHGDDCIAAGKVHTAGDGRLVSEISGKGDSPHVGIFFSQFTDELIRPVFRAVIDINQFIVHTGRFHDFCNFLMKKNDIVFFIVDRGDDRNHNKLL